MYYFVAYTHKNCTSMYRFSRVTLLGVSYFSYTLLVVGSFGLRTGCLCAWAFAAPTRKLPALTARCVPITVKSHKPLLLLLSTVLFVVDMLCCHFFLTVLLFCILFGVNFALATVSPINQWQLTVMQMSIIIKK